MESFGLAWPSLTRVAFAWLWRIYSALLWIIYLAQRPPPPPLPFDPTLWWHLKPATQRSYRRALNDFLAWTLAAAKAMPLTAAELDALLLAYLKSGVQPSRFRTLLAAVPLGFP